MRIRRSFIRETASSLLRRFPGAVTSEGIDPEFIAKSLGLEVKYFNLEEDLSGFLVCEAGKAYIGVNAGEHPRRQKFTIAHELGHFMLHELTTPFLDRKPFRVIARNDLSSQGIDIREMEANLFASELIMPAEQVFLLVQEIGVMCILDEDQQGIKTLAERFGVSVRAMTIRLERLGVLESV